jgi:hypothetical protein
MIASLNTYAHGVLSKESMVLRNRHVPATKFLLLWCAGTPQMTDIHDI